ncbi:MAG TPA: hypothetical protein VNP36_12020 [Burkholderiales bacterium]|nr:hypothetical protein [Burkholderiales bacterium]
MRRFAVFAFALACGCTPMQWQKDDVSVAQLQTDEQQCRQAAWREANLRSWQYQSMLGPAVAVDPNGRSYMVWPSSSVVDPYGYQLMEENRLAQFCMESKGYKLVPTPGR